MATRGGLTRESVVAVAAAIADREGLDALTLARLANKLRIKPPSLFNHVRGMPALRRELRLLALRTLGDALAAVAIGKSRGDGVRALAGAYRNFVRQHPGIYAETLSAGDDSDEEMSAVSDRILGICTSVMSGYSMARPDALHALRALRSIGHGFASLEAAHGFGIPVSIDDSYTWLIDNFIAGLEAAHSRSSRSPQAPKRSRTGTGAKR
jgi:AcrR family transcriptional regulator